MIVMRHRPGSLGWEFTSTDGQLEGGGRSLNDSIDAAEHMARHHFTSVHGYAVQQHDARAQVRHAIERLDGEPDAA